MLSRLPRSSGLGRYTKSKTAKKYVVLERREKKTGAIYSTLTGPTCEGDPLSVTKLAKELGYEECYPDMLCRPRQDCEEVRPEHRPRWKLRNLHT